jgi:hypothetical protein
LEISVHSPSHIASGWKSVSHSVGACRSKTPVSPTSPTAPFAAVETALFSIVFNGRLRVAPLTEMNRFDTKFLLEQITTLGYNQKDFCATRPLTVAAHHRIRRRRRALAI